MLCSAEKSCKNTEIFWLKILITTAKKIACRGGVFSETQRYIDRGRHLEDTDKDSLFEFSNYSSRAELNITKAFERTVNIGAF